MKRVLFALAILGCSHANDQPPVDAGAAPLEVAIAPIAAPITVVRGESTSVQVALMVQVSTSPPPTFLITTSSLPDGVTASPISTTTNNTAHVQLVFTASSDAPLAEIPIQILAIHDGKIVGTNTALLDVSNVVGSLDPTFGDHGFVALPNNANEPLAIAVTQTGTIVVAGFDSKQVFVYRFAPTEAPQAAWRFGNTTGCTAAAIADDGRVAVAMTNVARSDIVEVDANDTVLGTLSNQPFVNALAWDGDGIFFANATHVLHFGTGSLLDADTTFEVASLEVTAPGTVVAAGASATSLELSTLAVEGNAISASPSVDLSWPNMVVVDTTVTTASGTLVAAREIQGATVLDVAPNGTIASTYTLAEGTVTHLVAANGAPIVVGNTTVGVGTTMTEVGFIDGFDVSFGTLGHSYLSFGPVTTIASAVVNPTKRYLYVTGTAPLTSTTTSTYVARVRLAGP